ncbi:hypothetical protein DMA11_24035 [Marinilabiliaceae bacterium JC017]|nr:hypothetical protein DMA11_24035 [Marinilabiliaceae bacterium JC017]
MWQVVSFEGGNLIGWGFVSVLRCAVLWYWGFSDSHLFNFSSFLFGRGFGLRFFGLGYYGLRFYGARYWGFSDSHLFNFSSFLFGRGLRFTVFWFTVLRFAVLRCTVLRFFE